MSSPMRFAIFCVSNVFLGVGLERGIPGEASLPFWVYLIAAGLGLLACVFVPDRPRQRSIP